MVELEKEIHMERIHFHRLVRKLGKLSDSEFAKIKKSAQALLEPQSPNGYNVS